MSPEAMKLKEGMAGTQVQQEQENIDTKMATATAAATRGGSRVSAFEASGAADDAQRDLSSRRESAKRSGMKNAMDERGKLRQAQEARQQADQARQAQLTDYGREDIQNLQANQAAYETQMYGSIDAGIGTVASMSDRKEKKNIKKLGKTKSGVPVSEFEYKDKKNAPQGSGKYKGVIAQDLVGTKHGDAVKKIGKNTLGVNYGKLDIKLGKIGGGKLKDKVKKKYNKGGAPKKDFMEGGDADVTPGKFSHEENPIDLVQNNEEGNREKIGEMTGGEAIVPPKNVTQIRQMISNSDGKALVNLMDKLLTKWDKEAQENTEAREVLEKQKS